MGSRKMTFIFFGKITEFTNGGPVSGLHAFIFEMLGKDFSTDTLL